MRQQTVDMLYDHVSCTTFDINLLFYIFSFLEIQLSQTIIQTKSVKGVAWLEGNIYVVIDETNIVYVHPDQESIDGSKEGNIELDGMENPWNMVASQLSRSIFISEPGNNCFWRIQMPGRKISRWDVDGEPNDMLISSSDVLVLYVCVVLGYRWDGDSDCLHQLHLFRSSDVMWMDSILLSIEIKDLYHAVQLLNGNFVISYSMKDDPDVHHLSELSADGSDFIRNFDPRSIESIRMDGWKPYYLWIDEDENIFIADRDNDRVVLLNSRWTDVQILLNRGQHSIKSPWMLCYVREKQQLIVNRCASTDVQVFNLL